MNFKDYLKTTHNPYYSIVAAIPLLVSYEILLALTQNPHWRVRNAADVWLRDIFITFNLTSREATFAMIGLLLAAIPVVHGKYPALKGKLFAGMFLESILYSLLLGTVINTILGLGFIFLGTLGNSFLNDVALSLGAGLFEEFFFRVLLFNAIFFGLSVFIKSLYFRGTVAVLAASFLFSLSHYVGSLADPFILYTFLFRWIAGLLFTLLYFFRGFAIAAYTHALYDIWVSI